MISSGVVFAGKRARDGQISLEEMVGGSFTISNGGAIVLSLPLFVINVLKPY